MVPAGYHITYEADCWSGLSYSLLQFIISVSCLVQYLLYP
jgi:hypothetical protein